eukprot:TRINITY_DN9263_c0_g1_i1.p1 TRINITY_DN9263_c0_g1~~TRINITY_DN9263_c0_g1_i1.p1  ORF type:complete len:359 (-),score=72.22 TRINITY_DN9263_c0_g1_i1:79-1155(-)
MDIIDLITNLLTLPQIGHLASTSAVAREVVYNCVVYRKLNKGELLGHCTHRDRFVNRLDNGDVVAEIEKFRLFWQGKYVQKNLHVCMDISKRIIPLLDENDFIGEAHGTGDKVSTWPDVDQVLIDDFSLLNSEEMCVGNNMVPLSDLEELKFFRSVMWLCQKNTGTDHVTELPCRELARREFIGIINRKHAKPDIYVNSLLCISFMYRKKIGKRITFGVDHNRYKYFVEARRILEHITSKLLPDMLDFQRSFAIYQLALMDHHGEGLWNYSTKKNSEKAMLSLASGNEIKGKNSALYFEAMNSLYAKQEKLSNLTTMMDQNSCVYYVCLIELHNMLDIVPTHIPDIPDNPFVYYFILE